MRASSTVSEPLRIVALRRVEELLTVGLAPRWTLPETRSQVLDSSDGVASILERNALGRPVQTFLRKPTPSFRLSAMLWGAPFRLIETKVTEV